MRKNPTALAVLALALAGCPNEPAPELSPLYFFGDEEAPDGFSHSGYWNSGSRTSFVQPDTNSSDAFLSDSTVYVCGYRKNVGPGSNDQACYWTNGVFTALVDTPTDDSSALAVRISGTSLYIAGSLAYGITGAGYWKDGAANPLTDGSWATDVVEYGGATYVFGYYWTGSSVGGYWKIPSSGPTTRHDVAASYGNYVGKGDLHGDTYYLPGKGGYYVIDLGDDSSSFVALPGANVVERIRVNSVGVVRSVGTENSSVTDKASLWIGTLQVWAETEASEALDVVEYQGKTYVCGLYKTAGLEELACYWEDGVRHLLSDKDGSRAHTALLIQ